MLRIFSNADCIGTSKNWKPSNPCDEGVSLNEDGTITLFKNGKPITHMSGEKSIVALPNYGHNRAAYTIFKRF